MKYVFVIEATISLGVEVEADNLEEAVTKAKAADVRSLCYQCSARRADNSEWAASEIDCGDPSECTLVDFHTDDIAVDIEDALERWGADQ